ncbi:hypothetical protein PoB_004800400 [Plakobranchus ocellatus]|uniref:Uncharacterized protein n=1 Tax=Plakobranchus ocellatus TaxID=259542 RepID=A0AAV4BMZ4_9GAST|nr:hypothetical protein PoB_004800400 [Plakobranchus ocellatus]
MRDPGVCLTPTRPSIVGLYGDRGVEPRGVACRPAHERLQWAWHRVRLQAWCLDGALSLSGKQGSKHSEPGQPHEQNSVFCPDMR